MIQTLKVRRTTLALWLLLLGLPLLAQRTITGVVTDAETGEGLIGANVLAVGTSVGTISDFDGSYSLDVPEGTTKIQFSYIGYTEQTIDLGASDVIDVIMSSGELLDEVIVVGYGAIREEDATGAVELLSSKDLNKGAIVSADQMLNGKSRGVRIVNEGGQPDAAPNIRIRGGASLSANNSPLIVIDDVPISNNNPAGQANVFQLVNPNDIESFSILKDASATAIYGSRASNGVIIITTKKGSSGKPKVNFSSNAQLGELFNTLDVMDGEDFADFIRATYPSQVSALGVADNLSNTNWQEEIYRNSFSTDHNLSVSGKTGSLPYRVSVGYSGIEGILQTSKLDRYTGSFSLTPKLLDDQLEVAINAKAVLTRKDKEDDGAIGSALGINPTLPIFDPAGGNFFGGYYQTLDPNQLASDNRVKQGATNPIAQLLQRERNEDVNRLLGNVKLQYKLPFLPQLKAVVNLGLDYSRSNIDESLAANAINAWNNNNSNPRFNSGETFREEQDKTDRTMDMYLSYAKSLNGFVSRVDAQAGYSYQNFKVDGTQFPTQINSNGDREEGDQFRYVNIQNLQSFFGRVNFDVLDKFLFTVSYRLDGSSLFAPDNRWGSFPAAAVAWRLNEESWFEDNGVLDNLKFRAGWGITGQQDITGAAGYYPYSALYLGGDPTVSYQFGNQFFTTQRAQPFNSNLTWERTTTINAGIDFEFVKGIVGGSFDVYNRQTTDLLAEVPQSEGSLVNRFISNVGETEGRGWELGLFVRPVQKEKLTLELSGNLSRNIVEVTSLNNVTQIPIAGTGIGRGTGLNIGWYNVGTQGRSFWLYEQVYDELGKPVADAFVDQNNDGVINNEDRVFITYDPEFIYGFGGAAYFGNFDLTVNFRGQVGGKIYNANLANRGVAELTIPTNEVGVLSNLIDLWDADTDTWNGFNNRITDNQAISDYYVSDASFLRFDNIALGYKFANIVKGSGSLRLYGAINNVALFTNYDGIDPENFGGIEQSPYARPRVYTIGINLDF